MPIGFVPGGGGGGGGEKQKWGRLQKIENSRTEPMAEHKAKPNVPANFFVSEGGKKRKLGKLRMNENPMIRSR